MSCASSQRLAAICEPGEALRLRRPSTNAALAVSSWAVQRKMSPRLDVFLLDLTGSMLVASRDTMTRSVFSLIVHYSRFV